MVKILYVSILMASVCQAAAVKTGLDNVYEYRNFFADRRIGIIANQTAQNGKGRFIVDVLKEIPRAKVVALFAPEHGLWGAQEAGADVSTVIHPAYKIPVHSLYGRGLEGAKPSSNMLKDVDVLVFDIQDIGARFYTYIWTMTLAMEAAAETNTQFVVLDRPNPTSGGRVAGNVLETEYATFVGLHPIPVVHGMTVGELARLVNGQGWLEQGVQADLQVIPLKGWQRGMWFDQTGLTFIKPSPNIPDLETALVYPGLVLFEGTNVSEGRGTTLPFKQFGAPWFKSRSLLAELRALKLPGLSFETTEFKPESSKYRGKRCQGIRLCITDRSRLDSYFTGIQIIKAVHALHPNEFKWHERHFDRLCGTDAVRKVILESACLESLREQWQGKLKAFEDIRQRYLIY